MKSIRNREMSEIIEKKSLFINYTIPVRSIEQFHREYQDIKKEHPDATHHCYAYVIGEHQDTQKYYDDGEPSRTAGFPMLEVLLKQDLTDVLTVTVRYFGGVKLGGGGLIRAYSKSVNTTLENAHYSFLKILSILDVTVSFDDIGSVEHILRKDYELVHTAYDTAVHYHIEIEDTEVKNFQKHITELTNGKATFTVLKTIKRYE